ncbi:hypothetical protein [Rhodococcus wratislaviensis]|uniref:hypothetical protein n=1 Tax=Rhodococcus wratislaviensis TaxID=44752 RepID=UPI003510E072
MAAGRVTARSGSGVEAPRDPHADTRPIGVIAAHPRAGIRTDTGMVANATRVD